MTELNELARAFVKLSYQIEMLNEHRDDIKEQIKDLVAIGEALTTDDGSDIYISHEEYDARRFHSSLLKKEFPQIHERFNLKGTYTRLIVTE